MDNVKIESITLHDGRKAERHISVDDSGNDVVEIFAEKVEPLHLEKRIIREKKEVIAKETIETIEDGVVKEIEIVAHPEPPLQIVEKIKVADHAKIVNNEYVTKEEMGSVVTDAVVAGISTLLESGEYDEPVYISAQAEIEDRVNGNKNVSMLFNLAMVGIIAVQVVFFGYIFYYVL